MSREMSGGSPTPTAAEVIADAALDEIIEVVFGESNAEAHQRIGAAVLDALAAAGFAVVQLPKPDEEPKVGLVRSETFSTNFDHFASREQWAKPTISVYRGELSKVVEGIWPHEATSLAAALLAASLWAVGGLPVGEEAGDA